MTNGEKIKEVFPSIGLYEKSHDAIQINFDSVWWNAEYKEPTTKNDLGVDREDAVERLNALKQLIGYDKDSEIVKATQKSLDMAIKALEQEPTTKNDLGVDCISREQAIEEADKLCLETSYDNEKVEEMLRELPPVTPYVPKPMVEIDLYSVIKQKYIEREVLDKIRAEIAEIPKKYPMTMDYENGLKEAIGIIDKYKVETEEI